MVGIKIARGNRQASGGRLGRLPISGAGGACSMYGMPNMPDKDRPLMWLDDVAEKARGLADRWGHGVLAAGSRPLSKEDALRALLRDGFRRIEEEALAAIVVMERQPDVRPKE